MRLLRPRIFISYAHEDLVLASAIRDMLSARGFAVFVDAESMLGGEDFVRRLTEEVHEADAVVLLLTAASARSEWCQAEWYFAHARKAEVIPIRVGDVDELLPMPIRLLENRVHFLTASDAEKQKLSAELAEQLDRVRRVRRRRAFLKLSAAVLLLAGVIIGMSWLAGRVSWLSYLRNRNAAVARIAAVAQPLPGDEIVRLAASFRGDETMRGIALAMAGNPEVSDAARLTAMMLSSELLRGQKPEPRWALRAVKWRNGLVDRGTLVNTNFLSGVVDGLKVRQTTLASVFWGRELTLSNASFTNVAFVGGGFNGTNAIRLDFLACLFYGVEIDVTNLALARFRSVPIDPNHPNVITAGELCAFENSVIVNKGQPPGPGVVDLSTPADEVRFDGVVFTAVHFRGYIRPEWFGNCSFDRCTFPTSVTVKSLEAGGNQVSGLVHADEPLN